MTKKNNLQIVPLDQIPKANEVPTDNLVDIFRLVTQLEDICVKQDGIGISAAQVGIPWKLFIIQRDTSFEYYVNCTYEGIGGKFKSIEGCLSLRDKFGELRRFEVERYSKVRITGKRLKISDSPSIILEDIDQIENDLYAVVFQHEIDHHFQREKMIDIIGKEIELIQRL